MEIKILKNILSANDQVAQENRQVFAEKGILALNVMASPGAGKTTVIMETIKYLRNCIRIGVVEGDIAGSIDAEKISKEGIPVVQINTGGSCHLEAQMLKSALKAMPLNIKLLFIENVGNLICPGEFDLGEGQKVVLLSTPEGDDKPYKYPLMFDIADVILVTKLDLMPYVSFKLDDFIKAVRTINNKVKIFPLSATTGMNFELWLGWLKEKLNIRRP